MIFINFSNHRYSTWSEKQKKCTEQLGEVIDFEFPDVSPYMSGEEIRNAAAGLADKILELKPDYVMCQGEFCMTFAVVEEIKKKNPDVKLVAACSERKANEYIDENGNNVKKSTFEFVQYREY